MVTYKRRQILIDNISLLRKSFEITKKYYTFEIISINIMKDHLHLLLSTQNSRCRVHFNAPQLKTAVILDLFQTLSNKQHRH